MPIIFEDRPSDSPLIDRVWRSRSENISAFKSVASAQCDFVVWTQNGITQVAFHGPETHVTQAPVPEDAEFFGILFKTGIYMPHFAADQLVDAGAQLPDAAHNRFWLKSGTWELPNYDNAEVFVKRLVRDGLLVHDPVVASVMNGSMPDMSLRTIQRRFLRTTGLTHNLIQQIQRARLATALLQAGTPILDTVFQAGYFDQPHLNRALRHFIGQTPVQLLDKTLTEEMSFLSKTALLDFEYPQVVAEDTRRQAV